MCKFPVFETSNIVCIIYRDKLLFLKFTLYFLIFLEQLYTYKIIYREHVHINKKVESFVSITTSSETSTKSLQRFRLSRWVLLRLKIKEKHIYTSQKNPRPLACSIYRSIFFMGPSSTDVVMQDSHLPVLITHVSVFQRGNKSIDIRCLYVKRQCISGSQVHGTCKHGSWLEGCASTGWECARCVDTWLRRANKNYAGMSSSMFNEKY